MAKLSTYATATPAAGDKLAGVDVSASATRVFLVSALAAYAAAANCQIGLAAARPAAGTDGRLYYATDTETLSRDNGLTWDDLTTGGGGGAVDSVNGQTGVVVLDAADVGAAEAAHAASHAAAGSDPLTLTQAQITGLVAALAALQPLDSDLTAIAALTTTSYGRSLLEAANAAALRTLAGLGTAATADTGTTGGQVLTRTGADGLYQPLDSDLTAIAALVTTAFGRAILELADAAALRTAAALGTAATADTGTTGGQVLTRTGADGLYQPLDSDLTAIAALSTTSYGRALLALADAAALRTAAGLGTAATAATGDFAAASHDHAASAIVSGALALARGGTGADLSATGGTAQVLKQASAGAAVTVGALSASELPAHAHTGSTTGGTLTPAAVQMATARLLGRTTASTGGAEEITVGTGLSLSAGELTATGGGGVSDGDKGDVTVSASGATWTIDNDAVTYAKIQNVSATDKVLGRSTSGAGDVEEIACTAAGRALLDDADAAAQRATLGIPQELGYASITGDLTTTSSSMIDATGLSITITVGSLPIMVEVYIPEARTDKNGARVIAEIYDNTAAARVQLGIVTSVTTAGVGQIMFMQVRLAPSSGSRTYKMRWSVDGGISATGTLRAASTGPAYIRAYEVRN